MNSIQTIRKNLGISQYDIANELGIDRSTVAKWETGKALPRAEVLVKLAAVLHCTVDEILRGAKQ